MLKRSTIVVTTGIACLSLSNLGLAAQISGNDANPNTVTPQTVSSIVPVEPRTVLNLPICPVNYRYFYVRGGIGAYNLRNSAVEIGTAGSYSTAPLAKITDNGWAPVYHLALGYAFYNPSNSLITKIFGHDDAVEVRGSYFNRNETRRKGGLGWGNIWYIDGSGSMFVPAGSNLNNFKLTARHRLIDTGIYFRGGWSAANPKWTVKPRIGVVYTNLREKYRYTLNYHRIIGDDGTDYEKYDVNTNYYGIGGGGKLTYHAKPKLAFFGDLEIQLLHAVSRLKATQEASIAPIDHKKVNSTDTKGVTYRVTAAIGAKYSFTQQITSTSISVKAGIDRWGYDPRVVPPNHAGSKAIHITGEEQDNPFVMLELTVPIG